jgi:hypothetical protein
MDGDAVRVGLTGRSRLRCRCTGDSVATRVGGRDGLHRSRGLFRLGLVGCRPSAAEKFADEPVPLGIGFRAAVGTAVVFPALESEASLTLVAPQFRQ